MNFDQLVAKMGGASLAPAVPLPANAKILQPHQIQTATATTAASAPATAQQGSSTGSSMPALAPERRAFGGRGGGGGGGGGDRYKSVAASAAAASASAASSGSVAIAAPKSGLAHPKFIYGREELMKLNMGSGGRHPIQYPDIIKPGVEGCVQPDASAASSAAAAGAGGLRPGGTARAPPGFKGVAPAAAAAGGKSSIREVESLRDRSGASGSTNSRWNEPSRTVERGDRVEQRGGGGDRDRGDRGGRDRGDRGGGDRDRYESTPSWAQTEVKSALGGGDDDDTFGGGGGEGEFVLGAALDREADAKIMRERGWGVMFKATEDLEKQAAAEREEIRRKLREEEFQREEAGNFNSDFEVLPESHPLMQQKAAAAKAAAAAAASSSSSDLSGDDELAKLDELLAAKAAKAEAAKKLGSVAEEGPQRGAQSSPPAASESAAAASAAGTSKFASRFGFGLQDEAAAAADPWGTAPVASSSAPGGPKSSQWGFSLEESGPPDASVLHKFAATPNTNTQKPQQPPQQQAFQQPQQPQMYAQQPFQQQPQQQQQPEPVYRHVAVNDMFKAFEVNQTQFAPLPSMPTTSGVPLASPPQSITPTPVVEDSLQRLLSKQRNRKQGGGLGSPGPVMHSQPQQQPQIMPAHLIGQVGAGQQHGGAQMASHMMQQPQSMQPSAATAYSPYAAQPNVSAPPPSAALLNNPTFLSLPPHQQQQYLRHWQEQQQRAPQQQQQQQQPPQQVGVRSQPVTQQSMQPQLMHYQQSTPSHYAPVSRAPAGYPQQQQQAQPLPNQAHTRAPMQHGMASSPQLQQQPQHMAPHLQTHQQQQQLHQHYVQQQNQPQQQQPQHMIHGRMAPNHGVVPTTYGSYQSAPAPAAVGVGGPVDGGAGGDGLSKWFAHLSSATNLPALPPQAHQYHTMQQQQLMQQQMQQQQLRTAQQQQQQQQQLSQQPRR